MKGLTAQLTVGLATVQIVALCCVVVTYLWSTSELRPAVMSHDRAISVIEGSIDLTGVGMIAPSHDLQEYLRTHPGLLYGVLVDGRWLEGSTLTFQAELADGKSLDLGEISFVIPGPDGDTEGLATRVILPGSTSSALIATAGSTSDLKDLLSYVIALLRTAATLILPVMVLSIDAMILITRRALRPLTIVAQEAAAINLDDLNTFVAYESVPREIAPLVSSFNSSLERLKHTYAERRRFLDDAAHELKTPVAIIASRVDELPRSTDRALLQRDVRRLSNLADQLLASARYKSGWAYVQEPVRLDIIAGEVVADHAPLAHELGLDLSLTVTGDIAVLQGNAVALGLMLVNLVTNALRHEPKGGEIEVVVQPGPRVLVIDHGRGLRPNEVQTVFEPFWRGSASEGGTGLGLAIVRQIAADHGGRVIVESMPGVRTAFIVEFGGEGLSSLF